MNNDFKQNEPQTPDKLVAEAVIAALQKEGLIRAARAKTLIAKLVAGSLSPEDWSLEIELALTPKETRE